MNSFLIKKQNYACESLALYGAALIKSQLIDITKLKPSKDILIYKGNWPKSSSKTYGKIFSNRNLRKKEVCVIAQLFDLKSIEPVGTSIIIIST